MDKTKNSVISPLNVESLGLKDHLNAFQSESKPKPFARFSRISKQAGMKIRHISIPCTTEFSNYVTPKHLTLNPGETPGQLKVFKAFSTPTKRLNARNRPGRLIPLNQMSENSKKPMLHDFLLKFGPSLNKMLIQRRSLKDDL